MTIELLMSFYRTVVISGSQRIPETNFQSCAVEPPRENLSSDTNFCLCGVRT